MSYPGNDKLCEDFCTFDFDSFIPSDKNPVPDIRIMDYLTVGPFVLETTGSFESEHFYERDKILLEDYLAADGGERNIRPGLGRKVRNNYYGKDYLTWKKGFIKWNSLRFDSEEDACDPALFATEQRNAVYYAAFCVNCKKEEKAVISYVNSGSVLYVNGEPVDFRPFGRVKGLDDMGCQCPVRFRKGSNLIMFKIRPGYIADTMDISMEVCMILPVISECNGLCITSPLSTLAYTGSKEKPRMVFPFCAFAEKNISGASIECDRVKTDVPELKKGECTILRSEISVADERKTRKCKAKINCGGKSSEVYMYYPTIPYDGFEGNEHIFSDFHFDTTYHQEQRTYALGALHITKCITENLENNSDFKAILSEIDYLHPYYTLYPSHRKVLRDAFTQGRAEADCFYNQPNDLTSGGEAFVRNLIYGQIYHRDVLGRISRVYVPGDVFGHFSQISQVCRKGGCDMVRWGKYMLGVDFLFRHISPDGTALIHDKGAGRRDASRLGVSGCGHSSEALSYVEAYPRTGNTEWMKKTITNAEFSVFSDLADDILKSEEKNEANGVSKLDNTSRDITQHHSGVLLTRTDFKQANRLCENLLVSAEKFATVASLYGAKYPEKAFDKAWRQLLCAQHHDSITGTNNEISFVDLMAEYRECAETASDVLLRAARYIASGIEENGRNSVVVFNPVPSPVSGVCKVDIPAEYRGKNVFLRDTSGKEYRIHSADGKSFFVTGRIPSMGYELYTFAEDKNAQLMPVFGNDCTIGNRKYRLTVDKTCGGIVSIYDKSEKKEIIDKSAPSTGNAVYVLREIHDRMETQHEIYTTGHKLCSDEFTAEIKSEKCFDYEKLTVVSTLGTVARVIREITLFRNAETIDFRTIVEDYNSEDDLFTVAFPVDIKGGSVIFDDRFAPHVSVRSKKYMSFRTHQYASFSGCRILPVNRWFGVGPSVTVRMKNSSVNVGMTAIIRKNVADICNVTDKIILALTKKGIPVTPYPDCEQHGLSKIINFNEDIYETDTRIVVSLFDSPDSYTEKLLNNFSAKTKKKIEKAVGSRSVVTVFTRDSDNIYNKPVDVFLVIGRDVSALEEAADNLGNVLSSGYVVNLDSCITDAEPGEADNYGVSLINNGNIACSVEGKNTLNMMLFHTASFYGNAGKVTGDKELVPEKKTHVFTYELYPHKDSYREAEIYPVADAFNEKLFSVSPGEKMSGKTLPAKKSFLRVSPGFEVTAFKAGGYPLAGMKKADIPMSGRGVTLRGFETCGVNKKVRAETDFEIESAFSCDLLDDNGSEIGTGKNSFTFETGSHSIETFGIMPSSVCGPQSVVIGRETDITEPTYVRSWEHDMGSMPTGFLKFAATLDKKSVSPDNFTTVISVNCVNNSLDEDADVVINVVCSKGLKADKKKFKVSLGSGESSVIPLTVVRDSEKRKGQVTIYYDYDGQKFTDVYEFGYFNPEVTLRIENNRAICVVGNTTDQKLNASLIFVSPIETWDVDGLNPVSFGRSGPLARSIMLEPFETKEYVFDFEFDSSDYFKAYYAAVKLCCNGRIHFAFADVHGPRHNVWAHEFINEIAADNGSIKKLLEM